MKQFQNHIDGQWVSGQDLSPDINPSDITDVVGQAAVGGVDDVGFAVQAAQSAFEEWSRSSIQQRFNILDAAGTVILTRAKELGTLLAREEGKPIGEAIGEATRAGQLFKYFAGEAVRNSGELLESVRPGLTVEMTHEPVGVIGLITPWNFPIAIPSWKLAPALAYGNTVVLKPAELTPGCTWELVRILVDAGLPRGVLNLVQDQARLWVTPCFDQMELTRSALPDR